MSAPSEANSLLEHLVFEIECGVSGQTGEAFFRSLARHLAAALKADFVLVGALQPGGGRIATLAAYGDGADAPALDYALAGTPCANVVEKRQCAYPRGIQEMFPEDLKLAQMGAEGYAGASLLDTAERCLGLICAFTRQPLQRPQLAESLLQIFAVRAASELERKNYTDKLARGEPRTRPPVTHNNEAAMRAELEQRVTEFSELNGRLERENAYLLDEIKAYHRHREMVGDSPRFRELLERIRLVAGTSAAVLITGETGTGKELVAHAIHNLSPRRDRPLVKINCAALSAGSIENELFGHVAGRLEHAHRGTLFLDEITELPPESQSKILRVLQQQEFEPLGSNRTVKVDVRVLAATNRNLAEAVNEGLFRMDLYTCLRGISVDVPPLRDRREDIPALAAHFVATQARQFGRRVNRISEATMRELMAYDWPGNIRELENILARAVVLSRGDLLDSPLDLVAAHGAPQASHTQSLSLEDAERRHITGILASTGWVIEGPQGAAKILERNPSTLRSLMKRLGIRRPA